MFDRPEPPTVADERDTLVGFLNYQRATLAWKCDGLTPEQLASRAMPPSGLSLLGLLRHLAEVEQGWFRDFAGETDVVPLYSNAAERDLDIDAAVADPAMVERAYADWRSEIAHSDEIVSRSSLDQTFVDPSRGTTFTLRWVLVHMIEEYARHNGHADLLREALDGSTGE